MTDDPGDLCFVDPTAFLVPAEAVSAAGLAPGYARALEASDRRAPDLVRGLSGAIVHHWERRGRLAEAAPDTFLPPRPLNYLVVTDAARCRPYFEPFVGASGLVYASDFASDTGGPELGALSLCFAEMLGQTRSPGKAALACIGYLLSLEESAVAELARDVTRCVRPDSLAFDVLCEHLGTLRGHLLCEGIDLPDPIPSTHARIQGTGLFAPRSMASTLGRVVHAFDAEARRVADTYLATTRARHGEPEKELLAWLAAEAPRVVVAVGARVLWHPERPADTDAIAEALSTIGNAAAASLSSDLRTVDGASRRMRELLAEPTTMHVPTESIDESGGVWLRHSDAIVAYDLEQPGLDARLEPGPPYHRLLLAARTAHEWGHVAIENGVVRIVDPVAHARALRDIAHALERIRRVAAPAWEGELLAERGELERANESLETLPLARFEDYGANLLMRHALTPAELEAYVRNNVRPLGLIETGPLRKLSRYAYEAQYLGLGAIEDPWDYFVRITYFRDEMVESGLVTEEDTRALFDAVGRALGAFGIDETKLSRALAPMPRRIVA